MTTTSVSKSYQIVVENEKKTVTRRTRTDPCTLAMFVSVHMSDRIILTLGARRLEEHKTIVPIGPKAQTGHYRYRPYFHHNPHENTTITTFTDNRDNKDDIEIVITSNNNKAKMVHFAIINDDAGGEGEDEPWTDQDVADLSPQMIKTTTNFTTSKNHSDITSCFREGFGLFPQPNKTFSVIERRQEKEMTWFMFGNPNAFLDQMGKTIEGNENKLVSDTIDTKDCTEEQDTTGDCARNGVSVDDDRGGNEDDCSSIVSSSSSAVFEFFDDLSMLTKEDSICGDYDDDESNVHLHIFEDISLLTDDIAEENNAPVMVFSFAQFCYEEKAYSMEEFFPTGEKIVYKASKDHILLLDALSGVESENGFSPSDELRLA